MQTLLPQIKQTNKQNKQTSKQTNKQASNHTNCCICQHRFENQQQPMYVGKHFPTCCLFVGELLSISPFLLDRQAGRYFSTATTACLFVCLFVCLFDNHSCNEVPEYLSTSVATWHVTAPSAAVNGGIAVVVGHVCFLCLFVCCCV